jgi:hypothetical protein
MQGYVYLIGSKTFHWYKIGRSKHPAIRIQDLGILLPFKIEVFAVWRAESYKSLESLLHTKYKENRINGEWFSFDRYELRAVILDVPYVLVQSSELVSFTNMEEDLIKPLTKNLWTKKIICPKHQQWQTEHKEKWRATAKIESEIERSAVRRRLVLDRKSHQIEMAKDRLKVFS